MKQHPISRSGKWGAVDVFSVGLPSPSHDDGAVLRQPFMPFIICRICFVYLRIESLGVVHLLAVTQLVDDYAVDDFYRGEHNQTVKV